MKKAVVTDLQHGMIPNIQAKPHLVDSKLILLIRKQAEVIDKEQVENVSKILVGRPVEEPGFEPQDHHSPNSESCPRSPRQGAR